MKQVRPILTRELFGITLGALFSASLLIITSPLAFAAGSESNPPANARNNDFAEGKKAIDEKRWDAAIEHFYKVVSKDARNADAHNYLGLAYRWQNRLDESLQAYQNALRLDATHLGANEYLGQAYLKKGEKALAEAQLSKLKQICSTCRETESLASALAASK
jgi:tetratricopeptide (TPR) repeat protein